jgi:hypothetical protein
MTYHDLVIMIIIGSIFLIVGIIGFVWGRREEGSYYGSVSEHIDIREFLDHFPGRPEPGALRIGGKIAIAVGVILLLISLAIYFWGLKVPLT